MKLLKKIKADEIEITGVEPEWSELDETTPIEMFLKKRSRHLEFLNYYCSARDLRENLLAWLTINNTIGNKEISELTSSTNGKLARMIISGMPVSRDKEILEFYKKNENYDIKSFINDRVRVESSFVEKVKRSTFCEEKVEEKLEKSDTSQKRFIHEIFHSYDEVIDSWASVKRERLLIKLPVLEALLSECSLTNEELVAHMGILFTYLEKAIMERNSGISGNSYDKESWSTTPNSVLKATISMLSEALDNIALWIVKNKNSTNNKKLARKPRAPRKRKPESIVKHTLYDPRASRVKPIDCLNKKLLIVFNAKKNALWVFSSSTSSLTFARSKILEVSDSFSISLRRLDDEKSALLIAELITKRSEKGIFDILKPFRRGKRAPAPRLNANCALIQVL